MKGMVNWYHRSLTDPKKVKQLREAESKSEQIRKEQQKDKET